MYLLIRQKEEVSQREIQYTHKYFQLRESEFNIDLSNHDNVITFPTKHGGDLDALDDIEINTDGDEEG